MLDKISHASLIDGAKLSGAVLRVFPHNHLGKLESHLDWAKREHPNARIVIVTESVFSMDGDCVPLRELIELKKRFAALLLLDEAHAVGVIGPNGRGLATETGLHDDVDVQMGTLSKALGVSGGYVCGSRSLIEWLINRARSFIYSTAQPSALAAAARAAVEFLASPEGEERRLLLWKRIELMRKSLPQDRQRSRREPGDINGKRESDDERERVNQSPLGRQEKSKLASAIFPWIVGDEQAAMEISRALQAEGFLVPAVRFPTVAKGSARLRITVTASHDEAQIEALSAALARLSAAK